MDLSTLAPASKVSAHHEVIVYARIFYIYILKLFTPLLEEVLSFHI